MTSGKFTFLGAVRDAANFWGSLKDKTPQEIADGVAFSILVALDGDTVGCPPFKVQRLGERGEVGPDIAGQLHDDFSNMKR